MDTPLTREELAELQKKLAAMSMTALGDFYYAAHWRCRYEDQKIPPARHIQELVQVWKQLRKGRRTG